MLAKLFAIATIALTSAAYPYYNQCDNRWKEDRAGALSTANTVKMCNNGCVVTSVAMILADSGKTIDGEIVTPKSLNTWLRNNNGYSDKRFVWGSVAKFGLTYLGKNSNPAKIAAYHKEGKAVILNVDKGGHWVLLTGISVNNKGKNVYSVNDPGYRDRKSYTESDIVTAAIFTKPPKAKPSFLLE